MVNNVELLEEGSYLDIIRALLEACSTATARTDLITLRLQTSWPKLQSASSLLIVTAMLKAEWGFSHKSNRFRTAVTPDRTQLPDERRL